MNSEVYKVTTAMGAFGADISKATILWSNHKRLLDLSKSLTADDKKRVRDAAVETARKYTDANGKRRCVGNPVVLKNSQPAP